MQILKCERIWTLKTATSQTMFDILKLSKSNNTVYCVSLPRWLKNIRWCMQLCISTRITQIKSFFFVYLFDSDWSISMYFVGLTTVHTTQDTTKIRILFISYPTTVHTNQDYTNKNVYFVDLMHECCVIISSKQFHHC